MSLCGPSSYKSAVPELASPDVINNSGNTNDSDNGNDNDNDDNKNHTDNTTDNDNDNHNFEQASGGWVRLS